MHFYNSPHSSTTITSHLSMTQTKHSLLEKSSNYVKIFILLCLPLNTALAGDIFFDGFESGDKNGIVGDGTWAVSNNITISTENPKTGSYAMILPFAKRNSNGYSNTEQRFKLGGRRPEIWVKYDLFIPANYVHEKNVAGKSSNNKAFLALWAGTYSPENREGPLLWTEFRPDGSGGSVLDLKVASRINGIGQGVGGAGHSSNGIKAIDKGHWMTVIIHAKNATEADWASRTGGDPNVAYTKGDGVYEIWKKNWKGVTDKLINVQNGAFYATQPNSTLPTRGFSDGYLLGWANAGFAEVTNFKIDNFTISTTPLYFDGTAAPVDGTAAPKPPIISK